jgi:mono/diheme cytochrome c family protein
MKALARAGTMSAVLAVGVVVLSTTAGPRIADAQMNMSKGPSMLAPKGPSLLMPRFDSARGRKLFATQGCVICHSVNGVGGALGPSLDASTSVPYANPFDFAARMWRGADAMITLQEEELGYQIDLDGESLAHITAFAHDRDEQRKFSDSDIPAIVKRLMELRKL